MVEEEKKMVAYGGRGWCPWAPVGRPWVGEMDCRIGRRVTRSGAGGWAEAVKGEYQTMMACTSPSQ